MKTLFAIPRVLPILLLACALGAAPGAFAKEKLEVVENVDLDRYMGTWYEIASLPNFFQRNCEGTTARYTRNADGGFDVQNACYKDGFDGEKETTTAEAEILSEDSNAKFEVRFFWPLEIDYYIIALDREDYDWAMVGHPSRRYLWIISREPTMEDDLYQRLKSIAADKGFDVSELERTRHPPDAAARQEAESSASDSRSPS
jgi:apolipoprotein D and lipocalin family protein